MISHAFVLLMTFHHAKILRRSADEGLANRCDPSGIDFLPIAPTHRLEWTYLDSEHPFHSLFGGDNLMHADVEQTVNAGTRESFLSLGRNRRERLRSMAVAGVSIVWPMVAHVFWALPGMWIGSVALYVALTWSVGLKFTAGGIIFGYVVDMFRAAQIDSRFILPPLTIIGIAIGVVADSVSRWHQRELARFCRYERQCSDNITTVHLDS